MTDPNLQPPALGLDLTEVEEADAIKFDATGTASVPTPAPTKSTNGKSKPAEALTMLDMEIHDYRRVTLAMVKLEASGLTIIGGNNKQGKSAALNALEVALAGAKAIPEDPVHTGAKQADIFLRLQSKDTGEIFTIHGTVKPDRTYKLAVERENKRPLDQAQTWLNAMTGTAWFAKPLALLEKKPDEQAKILKDLLGVDTATEERQIAELFSQRTAIGRIRDDKEGLAKELPHFGDAPDEELSAADIQAELSAAANINQAKVKYAAEVNQANIKLANLKNDATRLDLACQETQRQIDALQEKFKQQNADAEKAEAAAVAYASQVEEGKQFLAFMPEVDTSALTARMTEVEDVNIRVRANKARSMAMQEWEDYEGRYQALTDTIEGLRSSMRKKLADAPMPVDGLKFNEDGTRLDLGDHPLNSASDSERMTVAVEIASLLAGGLRVCLIERGESYDLDSLRQLNEILTARGIQAVMARTSVGPECGVIITNGSTQEMNNGV